MSKKKAIIFIQLLMQLIFLCNIANATSMEIVSYSTPFEGSTLFVPNDGKEKHSSVIVFHGSEGGLNGYIRNEARMIARMGFATLFFCYYDCNRSASVNKAELKDIDLQKAVEAFRWMLEREDTSDKIAIYGGSRGAEKAMLITELLEKEYHEEPSAIALHAPTDTVVKGYNPNWDDWHCWPYDNDGNRMWDTGCGTSYPPTSYLYTAWSYNGNSSDYIEGRKIQINKYFGPIIITHGKLDQVWDYARTLKIRDSLMEARINTDAPSPEVHIFDNEGHNFQGKAEIKRWELLYEFFSKNLSW